MKCVKMEEKLLWRTYRNSSTLFRTVPFPTPMASPSSILGVCNWPFISGSGKAKDFKFGEYNFNIYMVIRIKALKNFGERERGRIQGLSKFLGTPYYLRNS